MAEQRNSGLSETEYKVLETYAEKNVQAAEPSEMIAETPALIQRGGVYLISTVLVLTLMLLYLGKVHVVVSAKGRIIPEGDMRMVQALQGGIVAKVVAHIGDRLPAGAPIAKVDVSESGINLALEQKKFELDNAQLRIWESTLAAASRVLANPQATSEVNQGAMSSDIAGYVNNVENALLKLEIAKKELDRLPEKKQLQSKQIDLLKDHIDLMEKNQISEAKFMDSREKGLQQRRAQLENIRKLAEQKLISPVELSGEEEKFRIAEGDVMQSRQRYDQQSLDVSNEKLKRAELANKLEAIDTDARNAYREARVSYDQSLGALRQQRDTLALKIQELESTLAANRRKIEMTEAKISFATITMPVAGTIAELKIRNTGELVTMGSPVATIIPAGVPLLVEAEVENKDIGFVKNNLDAQVKVDAYPFEQFGTAAGKVITVTPVVGGANFIVRIRLLQDSLESGDTKVALFPGLTVKVDLLTSKQRLLDLLLSSGDKDKEKDKKE